MSNTSTPINLISKLKEQAQKNKTLRKIFPKEDKRKLHKLVTGQSFDFFIMSIILADALILGMMTSDFWNLYFDQGLFLLDRLFMGIFIVEMFLKIYAERRDFSAPAGIFLTLSSLPFQSYHPPAVLSFYGHSGCFVCLSIFTTSLVCTTLSKLLSTCCRHLPLLLPCSE